MTSAYRHGSKHRVVIREPIQGRKDHVCPGSGPFIFRRSAPRPKQKQTALPKPDREKAHSLLRESAISGGVWLVKRHYARLTARYPPKLLP